MRIAMTGSTGLIGTAAGDRLAAGGHELLRLTRPAAGGRDRDQAHWDPATGWFRAGALSGVDAVVHLAGADIAGKRWTERRKRLLWDSRIEGTRLLVDHIAGLSDRPRVLVASSAVGFYGDRGEESLTEDATPGAGFLADLCQAWEREAQRAEDLGVRVVNVRTATVLSRRGGALARLLTPFRLGVGGRLGSGSQWFAWISLRDAAAAIEHLLDAESVSGPVNLTAPAPVTNADFTRALARLLRRPAVLPLPAFVLHLVFGGVADEALLASQRVLPARLEQSGFDFADPNIDAALETALSD